MAAQMLRRLLRRWWPVAALVALGSFAGLGYALLRQPVYAAKAYVAVVAQNSGDGTAVSFAQAYARIAGQGDVLVAAVRNSTGQVSAQDLQRAVRAASSPDAPVIEITGSASTARRAADLSNLVADGLISTANQRSTDTRVRLVVLSPALPPITPVSPRPALDTAVGAAAGLLLGGLALLASPGRNRSGVSTEVADRGLQRGTRSAPVVNGQNAETAALANADGSSHRSGVQK
jgi:capsular polysaccharide biosynthesis protein